MRIELSSAEQTFASWKRRYPDEFRGERGDLSSYIELDEGTGEPKCPVENYSAIPISAEECGREKHTIGQNVVYKFKLLRIIKLCPTCLVFRNNGVVTVEQISTTRTEFFHGGLEYSSGGPEDDAPQTSLEAIQFRCPLR